MNATLQPLAQERIRSLCRVLATWGYDAADFVFEQDSCADLAQLFGVHGGLLRVSRRSTGEARLYATGIDSAWFTALLNDLARGHLADAPETAAAPLVDIPHMPSAHC
jgi:hypothetical protein